MFWGLDRFRGGFKESLGFSVKDLGFGVGMSASGWFRAWGLGSRAEQCCLD